MNLTPFLAHDARISSLESKVEKLTARIEALQKTKPKTRKKRRIMDRAEHNAHVHMAEICRPVAEKYGVTLERMRSSDQRRVFMLPRWEAWKLCHEAGYSTPMIGRFFGGRDHTTILSGMARLEEGAGK